LRPRPQHGLVRLLLLIVVVAIAAGGFGVYWYFIRDDAPPAATVTTRSTVKPTSGPDGSYHVATGTTTFAGMRVPEHFGPVSRTAVVRTPKVSGAMTLSGNTVSSTSITVDLSALESKDSQPPGVPTIGNRVRYLEHSSLETSTFPTTTFKLTKPITLSSAPTVGAKVTVSATGTLTLHGVTKTVTIPLTAIWNGAVIDVSGSLPVALADYNISQPSLPFVSVDATGTLEFKLELVK
jgi:polyisoprenoid-binding protein YceI